MDRFNVRINPRAPIKVENVRCKQYDRNSTFDARFALASCGRAKYLSGLCLEESLAQQSYTARADVEGTCIDSITLRHRSATVYPRRGSWSWPDRSNTVKRNIQYWAESPTTADYSEWQPGADDGQHLLRFGEQMKSWPEGNVAAAKGTTLGNSNRNRELLQAIDFRQLNKVSNIWNISSRIKKKLLPIFFLDLKSSPENKQIYDIKHLLHC